MTDATPPPASLREEIEKFIDRNGIVSEHDGATQDVVVAAIEMFVQYEIDRERKKAVEEALRLTFLSRDWPPHKESHYARVYTLDQRELMYSHRQGCVEEIEQLKRAILSAMFPNRP